MKINKISQKILASVLMLAVLICGMFFLTSCSLGGSEDSGTKNKGGENIVTTPNENSGTGTGTGDESQDSQEDDLIVSRVKTCLSGMSTKLAKPLTKLSPPLERATSSIGLSYAGNYSSGINIGGESNINTGKNNAKTVSEKILKIMNSKKFKEGQLYLDSQSTEGGKIYFMVKIDRVTKTVSLLMKSVIDNSPLTAYAEVKIELNDNYSNWISYTNISSASMLGLQVINIVENGTKPNLVVNSINQWVASGFLDTFESFDFDTDKYLKSEGELSVSVNQFLTNKYGSQLNSLETKIDNVFNGKTVSAQLDVGLSIN